MSAEIIDGKALSASLRGKITERAERFEKTYGRKVGLAVIKVGANPASEVYVRNKIKACADTGIRSFSYDLPEETEEGDIISLGPPAQCRRERGRYTRAASAARRDKRKARACGNRARKGRRRFSRRKRGRDLCSVCPAPSRARLPA